MCWLCQKNKTTLFRDIEDRDRKTAQVCFVRGGDQREKEVGREKGGERVPVPER